MSVVVGFFSGFFFIFLRGCGGGGGEVVCILSKCVF